jgi:predicted neuraminidase
MKYKSYKKEYVFEDDRPFLSCHASTLVVLPNDEILTAYFAGTREKADDVAIWFSRRSKEGVWSAPLKLADKEGVAHWNPVLFQNDQGTIFLYYKVGYEVADWYTMVMESIDNGHTWTTPKALVEGDVGGRGPVRNKPVALSNGVIVSPASLQVPTTWNGYRQLWDSFADISNDGGMTWTKSEVPLNHESIITENDKEKGFNGVIQPTVWESDAGNVHMLMRSTTGFIYRSDSNDWGATWCEAYSTELPNNNSGIDVVRMESGLLALVYNPVRSTWGKRTPLVIRVSSDNGRTWLNEFVLENDPFEYSYPAIVSRGSELFITYTWKRERIAFWKLIMD